MTNTYNVDKISNWLNLVENLGVNEILNLNFWGDSITVGAYANLGGGLDLFKFGYVGRIRQAFQNIFENVGMGVIPSYYIWEYSGTWTSRLRWTFNETTNSWSSHTSTMSDNYGFFSAACESVVANSTASLKFNGTGIVILVQKTSDSGMIDISIDGESIITYDCHNASPMVATVPLTGLTNGDHEVVITKANDNTRFILLGAYETKGTRGIRCNTMAMGTGKIANISEDSLSLMSSEIWDAPLTIIQMVTNDINTDESIYLTELDNLVKTAQDSGSEVVLVTPINTINNTWTTRVSKVVEYAVTNNITCIDLYTEANGNPKYMWGGSSVIHPNNGGHRWEANQILDVILPGSMKNKIIHYPRTDVLRLFKRGYGR